MGLERWPPALDGQADLRFRNQLFADALAQLGLEASQSRTRVTRASPVADAAAGMMLRVPPALAMVQLSDRPIDGSDRSRICRIWCASSYSALRPSLGRRAGVRGTARHAQQHGAVARRGQPEQSSLASRLRRRTPRRARCRACVIRFRDPGELISSSPLMRTVSLPYSLRSNACSIADRVQRQRHAALVVGDAQPVGAVAFDTEGLRAAMPRW